jgi:hypothetical protein
MDLMQKILSIVTNLSIIGASCVWFFLWWSVTKRYSKLYDRVLSLEYEKDMLWLVVKKLNNVELAAKQIWEDRKKDCK